MLPKQLPQLLLAGFLMVAAACKKMASHPCKTLHQEARCRQPVNADA
jgi:hypothetical protein